MDNRWETKHLDQWRKVYVPTQAHSQNIRWYIWWGDSSEPQRVETNLSVTSSFKNKQKGCFFQTANRWDVWFKEAANNGKALFKPNECNGSLCCSCFCWSLLVHGQTVPRVTSCSLLSSHWVQNIRCEPGISLQLPNCQSGQLTQKAASVENMAQEQDNVIIKLNMGNGVCSDNKM